MLTKHQIVLHRQWSDGEGALFTEIAEPGATVESLMMTRQEFDDMEQPEVITITVVPGDRLNDEPLRPDVLN